MRHYPYIGLDNQQKGLRRAAIRVFARFCADKNFKAAQSALDNLCLSGAITTPQYVHLTLWVSASELGYVPLTWTERKFGKLPRGAHICQEQAWKNGKWRYVDSRAAEKASLR